MPRTAGITRGALDQGVRAVLRERGLRCTSQRLSVLRLLKVDDAHLTAAAIHGHLAAGGDTQDLATIYRTLNTLSDYGIVHAVSVRDEASAYGVAGQPHHHALCRRCGQISVIPAKALSAALEQARLISRYGLGEDSLTLHGLCPDCQSGRAQD